MTTSLVESTYTDLYDNATLPIPLAAAAGGVDRLRAIAASDYSVGHRLRQMLLTRILFDTEVLVFKQEEISIFEQVLAEGQREGAFWMMDDTLTAKALIAATNSLFANDTGTQVVDLLLQGLVRTSLPASGEFESAAA